MIYCKQDCVWNDKDGICKHSDPEFDMECLLCNSQDYYTDSSDYQEEFYSRVAHDKNHYKKLRKGKSFVKIVNGNVFELYTQSDDRFTDNITVYEKYTGISFPLSQIVRKDFYEIWKKSTDGLSDVNELELENVVGK